MRILLILVLSLFVTSSALAGKKTPGKKNQAPDGKVECKMTTSGKKCR